MKGQVIVLDREEKVVAVVTNEQVVEYDGYKVIVDHNEDCRYVPEEGRFKVIKPYSNKKTPQDVRDQGELIKLCSPIMEFLKKQPHPYHAVLIKEKGVELLETKQYIPQTKIQGGNEMTEITLMVDGKEMSKSLLNREFFI